MLFPISDDNRRLSGWAFVTLGLILANVAVFFLFQQAGGNPSFTHGWSAIPREITTGTDLTTPQAITIGGHTVQIPQAPGPVPIYLTILSAMFMHGGLLHLGGNMLYLWIFGDNVEHRFGSAWFLALYLTCGLVATFAQIALDPDGVVPSLGASGAISGVLGAYLVLFPRNRVYALFFFTVVAVPALVVIGLWILFQFINGYGTFVAATGTVGGVAYGAHIGGFFTGVLLAFFLKRVLPEAPDRRATADLYAWKERRR